MTISQANRNGDREFEVSDDLSALDVLLDEAALATDPARLADEAAAISMLGGRRVVVR